jgi:hypothetical protein
MRGSARKVRVFHKLEINEQTTVVSAANGYSTFTRPSQCELEQNAAAADFTYRQSALLG